MWILYLLSLIAGGFIAWLIDTVVKHIAEKENYSKCEFETRLKLRISGLVLAIIITSALTLIGACIALDKTDKEYETRIETLEQKVEQLESLNQVDTIVVQHLIDEEDLK